MINSEFLFLYSHIAISMCQTAILGCLFALFASLSESTAVQRHRYTYE